MSIFPVQFNEPFYLFANNNIYGCELRLSVPQDPVFVDKNEGLFGMIDNPAQEVQKRQGLYPESHNVLFKEDVVKLYNSKVIKINST